MTRSRSKTILQTSKYKPKNSNKEKVLRFAKNWNYIHFDDFEILEFFENNPIPGFENVGKRFKEIRRGEHRADLFRYYYIYLNGGFFIDSDFELKENLDDVVKNYDLVASDIKAYDLNVAGITDRSRAFNGYLYAAQPKNPIILQCLQHIYNIDIDDLGPKDGTWDTRYHLVCEYLYNVIQAYPDKSKIKIYKHIDQNGSFVLDGKKVLGVHKNEVKENKPIEDRDLSEDLYEEFLGFKELEVGDSKIVLYYCGNTAMTGFNSGIQRYNKKMAKALIELGVILIPVMLHNNELVPLTKKYLRDMSEFEGPKADDWYRPQYPLTNSKAFKKAKVLLYPELPLDYNINEVEKTISIAHKNNIKVISIFHDAIAYKLKDHYSDTIRTSFLKYMTELSASDVIVSVSKNSKSDYDSIIKYPRNEKIQSLALPLPHNIDASKLPNAKNSTSKIVNILCVSALENRKNHMKLLQAYYRASTAAKTKGVKTKMTLIAAYDGLGKLESDRVKKLCKRLGVDLIVGASEEQLREKYYEADFTVYPSIYEGFGIPIVESLQFNTPIICSNTSSMGEIADALNLPTFDPYSVPDIARAIEEMVMDKNKRKSIVDSIKKIKPYSWKHYAADLLKII